MPRPFTFPDPDDRSPNNPSTLVSNTQVLGLYKTGTGEKMQRVTEKVSKWFEDEAKKKGWSDAKFSGGQCFLTRTF
jgi:hypothetical protein